MKLILQSIKALFRKIEASRTHWDTRRIVTKEYTFDGDIDGKETIRLNEVMLLVKIADTFPKVSSITNSSIAYTNISEGQVHELELSLTEDVVMIADGTYSFSDFVLYTSNGGELEGVYIPSGLYFTYFNNEKYTLKFSFTYNDGELKKLDVKYLPDEIREMPSKMEKKNPTGTGSFSLNRKADTTIGTKSFAEGNYTTASGDYSHAEGNCTTASGDYSHAEGNSTTASGFNSHAEGNSTTASGARSHAEGSGTTASGSSSHAEGNYTTASGNYSHAEGNYTTASGSSSHAEGNSTNKFSSVVTVANPTNDNIIAAWKSKKFSVAKGTSSHVEGIDSLALGLYSHAEGDCTTASGSSSHAEGNSTTASGNNSHAEGSGTTASVFNSHAEGNNTTASGGSSHAEGSSTTASGNASHTEGLYTKASGDYQHAQGKYNIEDSASTYADIIGNGTGDTARSNAATVDWSGNAWYAGDVYVGSTSGTNKDAGSKKLATEEYVNSAVSGIPSGGGGDYIPVPETVAVGQTVIVTGVDESGKPTGWGVTDVPSDDHINSLINTALGVIENGSY